MEVMLAGETLKESDLSTEDKRLLGVFRSHKELGGILGSTAVVESMLELLLGVRGALGHLHLMCKLWCLLDSADLDILIHESVITKLNYYNSDYIGLPPKTMWKMQLVHNEAEHNLTRNCFFTHILPILKQLCCLPSCFHVQFKVLVLL